MALTPQDRYQSKPFLGSSHSWAQARLKDLPPTAAVLDVGPGNGLMGKFLGDRGVKNLVAVEIDADAREHVRPIYREVVESLAQLHGQRFDMVLLLDVLEHMSDPEAFLRDLQSYLTPGGRILISVPNIAHWSVRIPLLFGSFNYTSRGILDRTHLQFFTRKRVYELLGKFPKLSMREINSSLEPLEFVLPRPLWNNILFKKLSKLRLLTARALPGFFAYQHLVMLELQER